MQVTVKKKKFTNRENRSESSTFPDGKTRYRVLFTISDPVSSYDFSRIISELECLHNCNIDVFKDETRVVPYYRNITLIVDNDYIFDFLVKMLKEKGIYIYEINEVKV